MADEKQWQEAKAGGQPEGEGGTSSPEATTGLEVGGRSRQLVASCFKCGTTAYVGVDWKWFTCWKCGGTNSEMMA